MHIEYNGHLNEDERINQVINEIITEYSNITKEQAKKIAMIEGKISTNKTTEIHLDRLYNIMLVLNEDKQEIKNIYNDFIKLINSYKENEIIYNTYYGIAVEIFKFLIGERDFPYLNEF